MNLEKWPLGDNGKPSPPKDLQRKFLDIVNEQMEKYLEAGMLTDRFSIRSFGLDLMATGYKMCMDDVETN